MVDTIVRQQSTGQQLPAGEPKANFPPKKAGDAKNVLSNWASQFIMVISGFFLPRLINDQLGTAELGVWDLGWSMQAIISMSGLGFGSSANHHVAKLRNKNDWTELNQMLSATATLVLYAACGALMVTSAIVYFLPWWRDVHPGGTLIVSTQYMAIAMGVAAACQMLTMVYGGVLVGSHRFVQLNYVEIVGSFFVVVGVMVSLLAGWGLIAMASFVAARFLLEFFAKRAIARKICPELQIGFRSKDTDRFKEIAAYGLKDFVNSSGMIILNQGVVFMLLRYHMHGEVAVAILSRPRALIRFATRFLMGYARVLVPHAGKLTDDADREKLRQLLIEGTKAGLLLTLPLAAFLFILGRQTLQVWMNDEQFTDHAAVLTVLLIGFTPFFAQRPTWHVLLGAGIHGIASAASFIGAIASIALCYIFLTITDWGLLGAASAMAIPLFVVNGFVLPWVACRKTGMSFIKYWSASGTKPLALVLPFAAVLVAIRAFVGDQPLVAMITGFIVGGLVIGLLYWRFVLPSDFKAKLGRLPILRSIVKGPTT